MKTLEERFWAKVDKSGECWRWTGANKGGRYPYGTIWVNGRDVVATHVAWELANGNPFPDGMDACHHCDNPSCVRPDHLFVGSPSDNLRDAAQKGRCGRRRPAKCLRGHDLSGDNLRVYADGSHRCHSCELIRNRAYKERRRAARRGVLA